MSERSTTPPRTTPLRQRMIEDMAVRNLSPTTKATYVGAVKKFNLYYGCSPADLGVEDVRAYQVHLVEQKVAWARLNHTVSALRFLYGVTLGRADLPKRFPYACVPKTLPMVLSTDEVARLLDAVEDPTCRVALITAYATGMRTAEVLAFRIEHIESTRELIRIEQGKGARVATSCCHRRCWRRCGRIGRSRGHGGGCSREPTVPVRSMRRHSSKRCSAPTCHGRLTSPKIGGYEARSF